MVTSYNWDGLALIKRGGTEYPNEPAVTGGNSILAFRRGAKAQGILFNDMLGTAIGMASSKDERSFVWLEQSGYVNNGVTDGVETIGLKGVGTGVTVVWNDDGPCVDMYISAGFTFEMVRLFKPK